MISRPGVARLQSGESREVSFGAVALNDPDFRVEDAIPFVVYGLAEGTGQNAKDPHDDLGRIAAIG
jgi:hypothetical protein